LGKSKKRGPADGKGIEAKFDTQKTGAIIKDNNGIQYFTAQSFSIL